MSRLTAWPRIQTNLRRLREDIGFPSHYYQLSYQQKIFIDYLLDKVVEMSDNIESLETEIEADQKILSAVEEMNVELEHKIEILPSNFFSMFSICTANTSNRLAS